MLIPREDCQNKLISVAITCACDYLCTPDLVYTQRCIHGEVLLQPLQCLAESATHGSQLDYRTRAIITRS